MKREDIWGFLGSLLLFVMAYFDAGWRWFWAGAGAVILVWTIYTFFFTDDSTERKL